MLNSWSINIIGTIILTVLLGGVYITWKHGVEQSAILKYTVEQQAQIIQEQKKLQEDLQALHKEELAIIADLKDRAAGLDRKFSGLEEWLNNLPKDQKGSSEILKRTIKELSQ